MRKSTITAIQKQLNDGFQTVVSFGKKVKKELTEQQITRLENQLRVARLLEPKQLWTSMVVVPQYDGSGIVINFIKQKVQGTYVYSQHGELNNKSI